MGMSIDECFKWLEYHKQGEVGKAVECIDLAMDTMRKYQKIEQIIDDWEHDVYPTSDDTLDDIERIVEDGSNNQHN